LLNTSVAPATATAAEGEPPSLEVGTTAEGFTPLSFNPAALEKVLVHALETRRERWRGILTDAAADVQKLVMRLAGCSCRGALGGLAMLLTRLAEVLPCASAKEILVSPLLALQGSLGQCIADDACKPPPSARGDVVLASGRVAMLLASIASHASGRAAIVTAEPPLLGSALTAALQPTHMGVRRAGLLLLRKVCDPDLSLASYQCPPVAEDVGADDLPSLSVLGPAAVAAAAIADDAGSGCQAHARQVLQHVQGTLLASTQSSLRELGQALSAADPIAALHAMEGDFASSPDESAREQHLRLDDPDTTRAAIWPAAWQPCDLEGDDLLATIVSSAALFGSGLVRTKLEYARPFEYDEGDSGSHKRVHSEVEINDRGDAPPPVRGGRGRVREENPLPRGKPNTSRPASKHVDDYSQLGKRFQNSSRAPSKHVDDYQPAPVVRKTVDAKAGGPEGSGPSDATAAQGADPPGYDARLPTMPACGCRGSDGGGGAGSSMVTLQMLQQQLGMAAAQSLPPGMQLPGMALQMPPQPRPGMGGPMAMGMTGMLGGAHVVGAMPGIAGVMGGAMAGNNVSGSSVWRAPAMGSMGGLNSTQGSAGPGPGSAPGE